MTPALAARYREPQRRYHTLEHVGARLAALAQVADLSADPAKPRPEPRRAYPGNFSRRLASNPYGGGD